MASEIRVNSLTNRSGLSTVTIADTGVVVAGVVTSSTFSGPLTGDVTGNTSGTAGGLTGSPSITVTDITASGNVSIAGVLTYEDVTNIDAVGIITAGAGVKVPDNQKIFLGTDDDLQIYHDGSSNVLFGNGIADLVIKDANHTSAIFDTSAEIQLYYDNAKKLETTATGATVTGTLVSDSVTSELDLTAISSSISDTAVDVFVYDTRKDSDGGAWRKRTQNTSWYNETLNTSTRGSRKEFPAVAVIVAEAAKVTIYDGDDPDLPLWIMFETNSSDMLVGNGINAVTVLNGILSVVRNTPIIMIDFIKDNQTSISPTSETHYIGNIEQRNDGLGYTASIGTRRAVANGGNDVAMTVLPNAPIDDTTGLPIPTIAVATNAGISVIKDDGTVVDPADNSSIRKVAFKNTTTLIASIANNTIRVFDNVGGLTDSSSPTRTYYTDSSSSTVPAFGGVTLDEPLIGSNGNDIFGVTNKNGVTSNTALTFLSESGINQSNNMVAYIASDYNTGYMQGDIKGAFLSDTDTTNVVGTEMVTNGTFASNTTGWSVLNTGTFTASGGQATLSDSDGTGTSPVAYQQISGFVVGRTYVLSYDTTASREAYAYMSHTAGQNNQNMHILGYTGSRTGTQTVTFIANATSMIVNFSDGSGSDYNITVDNVSVKLGDSDRSVNKKGLIAYGTITKSAVATGADLVAYSGNGSSNYLAQPYNSDLDFGLNSEFSITGWMYNTPVGGGQFIFDRSVTQSTSRDWQLWVAADLRYMTMYIDGGQAVVTPNGSFPNNVWFQYCVVRKGNRAIIYINGVEIVNTASTLSTIPASNVPMKLLVDNNSSTKQALLRISASVPSPEQIKKIYEDEKVLFQENVKCTLYGSSDAVTALAFDDTTNLLHVGTSAGRSEFQGLRRINNTTDAVTTAISASNGLVAEQ